MATTRNAPTPLGDGSRETIAHYFGQWTARSALQSGSPVKSKDHVYAALDEVHFKLLFSGGVITQGEFDQWHKDAVSSMCQYVNPIDGKRFSVSSAAKAIAVYLKTVCYLSGYGRPGLVGVIYPPFDQSLMKELSLPGKTFPGDHEYDHDEHMERVKVAHREAAKRKCLPIELEQLWRP